MGEKLKSPPASRWPVANVLDLRPDHPRKLWHFSVEKLNPQPREDRSVDETGPIPQELVGKDWRAAVQKRLNIAWLPADRIFLRALQLPLCEADELAPMLELQLEKLSPLPVGQVVWTHLRLPGGLENQQTILLVILPRSAIDQFLGALEARGFNPDRLDLPLLDQILALQPAGDSAWLIPINPTTTLAAWWANGAWQNISLLGTASVADRPKALRNQIAQIQWAGELEGWLLTEPAWHLVGGPETVHEWEPAVAEALGHLPETHPPLAPAELAARCVERAVRSGNAAPIVPPERALAYQQQLNNRLWIGALGAVLSAYVIGVILYVAALQVVKFQHQRIEDSVKQIANSYTNAFQMKKRVEILEQQANLKFAALDAWKTAAVELPQELQLSSLVISGGKKMTLFGTGPQNASEAVNDYNTRITRTTINGQKVSATPPDTRLTGPAGSQTLNWNFVVTIGEDTK
jgi:hypothetical protein